MALRESIRLPACLTSTKSDPWFKSGFLDWWIDLSVCRITPAVYWIRSLVGINILLSFLKRLIMECWGKWKMIWNPYLGPDHHQKLS